MKSGGVDRNAIHLAFHDDAVVELANGLFGFIQVVERMSRLRFAKLFFKEDAGALMDVEKLAALSGLLGLGRRAVLHAWQRNAQLLRHHPHRLREGDVLDLLHKAENVTGDAAAKTVKKLARGMDEKRWCLFLMERT